MVDIPATTEPIIWADEVEAESQHQRQEVIKDGIKTVTDYYTNDDKKLVKVVHKYKIETKRVSSSVANRKKLTKFGDAKNDPPGPNVANTSIGETIKINFIRSRGGELLELTKNQDDAMAKLVSQGVSLLKCRFCKAPDHMSAHCPYKEMFESANEQMETDAGQANDDGARAKEAEEKIKHGIYVAPSLKGGAAAAASRTSMDMSRRDDLTVRVTNLPDETTEEDLRDMFSKVGKIQRIFLAKDKTTGRCKGFAFITYYDRDDAEKAIHTISGHRYDYLILKVEWAKQS